MAEDYLVLLGRLRHDLDEVDAAMRRAEEGAYGKCEACGSPLDADRLASNPIVRYCAACTPTGEGGRLGNPA